MRSPPILRYLLLASLICAAGSCRSLRNQLKALSASDSTGAPAPPAGADAAMPRAYGWSHPTPILDQTFHVRHDRSEREPVQRLSVPRFDWSDHSGHLGAGFGDGSTSRHQRGS